MKNRSFLMILGLALLLLGGLCASYFQRSVASAQDQRDVSRMKPFTSKSVAFSKTMRVRDIPESKAETFDSNKIFGEKPERQIRKINNQGLPREENSEGRLGSYDGALQIHYPQRKTQEQELNIPAADLTFEGLSSDNNATAFGFRVLPPDTVGDVGPNHYVQAVNLLVRVFDKSGAPLTNAFKMSTLFSSLGAPCGTRDDGDPIVLYDQLADRWLISQFTSAAPYHQCIAISQTSDPTGAYYAYAFQMPNNKFNDYPHFGVWPDGYYMSDNQFTNGISFSGAGVFAFDRSRMLQGLSASFIYFDLASNDGGLLPADLDGAAAPAPNTPNYFAQFTAGEFGDPGDAMRIWEFRANFANPGLSSFIEMAGSPVAVAPFNPTNPAGRNDIEQPAPAGSSNYLDSIQDRLMHRLAYRNFGTHEALVVTHTVNVGTGTTVATHRSWNSLLRVSPQWRRLVCE